MVAVAPPTRSETSAAGRGFEPLPEFDTDPPGPRRRGQPHIRLRALLRSLRGLRPVGRRRARLPRRRGTRLATGAAVLLGALLALALVPVPALDRPLTGLLTSRIAGQMSCGGAKATPPAVTIGGGRLLPQLVRRTLSEVHLVLADASIGGVEHATFTATLHDVSQPKTGTTHIGRLDAAITIGYRAMPGRPDLPAPTFGRAADGSLTIAVTPTPEMSKGVKATLMAALQVHGETLSVVPKQLQVFGKTLPADQVAEQTGGVRTQQLPKLPAGLAYRSVTPGRDGLHVAIGGAVTTPFSQLPTTVGGRAVSYRAKDGLLGIATAADIPVIGSIPLTLYTEPHLGDGTLTLQPRSVDILGSDRKPGDPIAALVLSQISEDQLTQKLPELPTGVRYRSVRVDDAGITMVIDGVTVRSFAELPAEIDGRPATYGARDGLLTVTITGATTDHPTPIVLHTRPTIAGTTLDLSPQQVEMFGVAFPASDVLSAVNPDMTRFPLQALPGNLGYRGVEVLADGLRVTVGGRDVTLTGNALGTGGC